MIKTEKIIILIILIFTALQIIILFTFGYTPYHDSDYYIIHATESLKQGEFFYPTFQKIKEDDFIWNIGSINAVLWSLAVFRSITPLLITYSLMKGATALFVYIITKNIINSKAALLALIIYVIYPANYGESTSTLSEIPFIFFNVAGIAVAIAAKKHFAGGTLMAAGNWFRPMSLIFMLSMVIFYIFKRQNVRKNIIQLLSGYIIMTAVLGGISYINNGKFIYQGRQGWITLMQYSWNNDRNHENDRDLFNDSDPMYYDKNGLDCLQRDSLWRSKFFKWLANNPGEYFRQMPYKFFKTYISDNVNMCTFIKDKDKKEYMYGEISMPVLAKSFPAYSKVQILTMINLLFYYALMIIFCIGTVYFLKKKEYNKIILSLSIITLGTLLLMFVGHGEARYHTPFMPFVIMLVAAFLNDALQKRHKLTVQ